MEAVFPTDVREFDADDRISFSKLDNKFIAVYDDGTEYEFDAEAKRWVPIEDEPLEHDAQEYGGENASYEEEEHGAKKRKNGSEVSLVSRHTTCYLMRHIMVITI